MEKICSSLQMRKILFLSAHVLYTIDKTYEEINGKIIADLGCGSGILAIGCSLLGSSHVIGIDVDPIALRDATENIAKLEAEVELLMSDVSYLPFSHKVDTTVMNPPFGTRNKGIDLVFLKKAIELSKVSVYSLHKSSTREHIEKKISEWGFEMEVLAELRWDIPQLYKFHKKKSVDIEVDFIRVDTS